MGMWFMGLGGLVAVVGGLLYLSLVIVAWRRRKPVVPSLSTWEKNDEFNKEREKQRTTDGIGGAGSYPTTPGIRGGTSLAKAHGQPLAPSGAGHPDSGVVVHRVGID